MTAAFGWLNDLVQTVAKLIPRLKLVRATYSAAVYRRDGSIVVREPGLFWFWPVTTDVRMVPRTIRSHYEGGVPLCRSVATVWDVPVIVYSGAVVQWRVEDVVTYVHVHNVGAWIRGTIKRAIIEAWRATGDAAGEEQFRKLAATRIGGEFSRRGLRVVDCTIDPLCKQVEIGTVTQYSLEVSGDFDVEE